MDQTTKPLVIPPKFALYAEKHGIFELYQRLLSHLVIDRPDEPIQYMIDFIKKDADSPAIIILGPPASGKKTIARELAKTIGAVLLTKQNLLENIPVSMSAEIGKLSKDAIQPDQWARLIRNRLDDYDCIRKGWILEGFPETRAQALAIQSIGILPKHIIFFSALDHVLIERAAGKRVDQKTEEIYHTTFHMPAESSIRDRLKIPLNYTENDIKQRFIVYHRNLDGIQECLRFNMKEFNVDQPKGDVLNQVLEFVGRPARTCAPVTPRIILIGPIGSGRRTIANLIAKKYGIVDIRISKLIKEAISNDTKLGNACKQYVQKKVDVPDSLVLPLLKERLGQLDCVSKGWIIHGFPKNREQAEALERSGHIANRVFILDIPNDSVMERLTLRNLDPVTGENYHILTNPPLTQEVRDRLRQKPSDTDDLVRIKLGSFHTYLNDLLDYYENAIHINADQDRKGVYESIEHGIVNPLPKQGPIKLAATN